MRIRIALVLAVSCLALLVPDRPVIAQNAEVPSRDMTPEERGVTQEVQGLVELTLQFCEKIYPRPTLKECIARMKHAVGSSADAHSAYLDPAEVNELRQGTSGKFGGLGIEIQKKPNVPSAVIVVNVLEGTPADRAGLLGGDLITHIITRKAGEPDADVRTVSLPNIGAAVNLLRGAPGTKVVLKVARPGVEKELEFTLVRDVIKVVQVEGDLVTHGGKTYALIKNKQFSDGNAALTEAKFTELQKKAVAAGVQLSGLIVSVEGNPGGLLHEAYNLSRLFITAPKDIILMRTNDSIMSYYPVMAPERSLRDISKGLPMLVVVNSGSASASEIFAKAMQHYGRAVVAGTSVTFGKGIVQTIEPLPGGDAMKYTSAEYLIGSKDDWVPVQCIGVVPDILFTYPGIKVRGEPLTECSLSGHVNTAGTMKDAPPHMAIKDANPALYETGHEMLEAYKVYMLPKLDAQEKLRKSLEE